MVESLRDALTMQEEAELLARAERERLGWRPLAAMIALGTSTVSFIAGAAILAGIGVALIVAGIVSLAIALLFGDE